MYLSRINDFKIFELGKININSQNLILFYGNNEGLKGRNVKIIF